ncbi:hypothetical protein [Psychrobacter pygoscelis]|uniref:hypothetical protein n=1 Tax=Psychrobacter pygoscelis TaxID=2488563 RepID=UPI00103FECFB|nr:hypothetical protein [Psychrobacter pygoscelis]
MKNWGLTALLLSLSLTANSSSDPLLLPNGSDKQLADRINDSFIDTSITLADTVTDRSNTYTKREAASLLTDTILNLYDYDGFFSAFRDGLKVTEPVTKDTASFQVAYLQCLQRNLTSQQYAKHLQSYSIIYVNSINDKQLQADLILLKNPKIKQLYRLSSNFWESAIRPSDDKQALTKKLQQQHQELLSLLRAPENTEYFQTLEQSQGLALLLNTPMMINLDSSIFTGSATQSSLVDKFIEGTTSQCAEVFQREFRKKLGEIRPLHNIN